MSDTPETDAMEYVDAMCDPDRVVESKFARKLERERDTAIGDRNEILQLLRDIRSRWGGLVTDDGCDCNDCEFLRPIDSLLNKYTNKPK